jgi:hypothetical protein
MIQGVSDLDDTERERIYREKSKQYTITRDRILEEIEQVRGEFDQ